MIAPRLRGAWVLGAAVALAACGSGTSEPGPDVTPTALAIVSGNGQVGLVGSPLSSPLVVRVVNNSTPIRGVNVNFAVTSGAASVSPATVSTDSLGQAKTVVTLGATPGNVTISATVPGTSFTASFIATSATQNSSLACASGGSQTPNVATVQPGVTGTGICLGGGSTGAEYALIAFYADQNAAATQSFSVTGRGATGVTSASALVPTRASGLTASLVRAPANNLRASLDASRREIARRELTPMMASARDVMRRRASRSVIPANPAIGSLVSLNANGLQACSGIKSRTSRVAAVSSTAIVVADTGNPAGGFTDAEYLSFARMFDTLITPLATSTFGTFGDVDNNGKVVLFFTKEVNALTPKSGAGGVVGAFFFERDLFPLTASNGLDGCAGSNYAEMMYLLVPDPDGLWSVRHTKQDVLDLTPSTLVHEYQHLINASRRLYTNNADDFEETWLNEGLSHIGEELLYYHVAGLTPRQNIGPSVFTTQAAVDAFNNYQGDNSGRFETFIGKPNLSSPFGEGDLLETRGAVWHLLRYLADHRGSSDGDTWTQLVNTRLIGMSNLERVFGATTTMASIRDWATSLFTDDLTGVTDARYLEPSWNMRAIFPRLVNSQGQALGRYPLAVIPVSDTPANVTIFGGGAAYMRFSVAAGSQASIDWSSNGLPVSGLVQFTLVRTK